MAFDTLEVRLANDKLSNCLVGTRIGDPEWKKQVKKNRGLMGVESSLRLGRQLLASNHSSSTIFSLLGQREEP